MSERVWRKFLADEYQAALDEAKRQDPIAANCTYRYFVSTSNGRGRKPRPPREVELVGYSERFRVLTDDPGNGLDIIAEELLDGSLPPGVDKYPVFVARVRGLNK